MIDLKTHKEHSLCINTSKWGGSTLSMIIEDLLEAQKKIPEDRLEEDLYFSCYNGDLEEIQVNYWLPKTPEDIEEELKRTEAGRKARVEHFRKLELQLKGEGLI